MKPGFQQDSVMVKTSDGHNFELMVPLVYVTQMGARLTIPPGTTTDGASTPQALWSAIPPFGPGWKAYVLHDWLYRNTKMPRIECDDLLKEAMLSLGVDAALAETIYQGVRIGGQQSFDKDRAIQ